MTLRSYLVTLVVVALVPLILFSAILLGVASDSERAATARGLRTATRATALSVDHALDNAVSSLEVLATSERLDAGDLAGFHAIAARALESQRGWLGVALLDPAGLQLLNTLRPLGTQLPTSEAPWVSAAIATREPVVSDLVVEGLAGRPHVMIAVPVMRERVVRGVLVAAVDSGELAKVLVAQHVPDSWMATLVDAQGTIVARVPDGDRYVGGRMTPDMLRVDTSGPPRRTHDVDGDGVSRYTDASRLQHARWTVVLGMPTASMDGAFHRWVWTMAAGGVLFLAAGAVLAAVVGRRLTTPIVALSTAAARIGAGETPAPPTSGVREVAALGAALTQAAQRRHEIESERVELLARAEAARERASLLAETSTLLATSLDYHATLRRLARLLVPRLADLCVIDVVDDDGAIRRVAAAHANPTMESAARELQTRFPPRQEGDHPVARTLRSGRVQLASDISAEELHDIAPEADHRHLVEVMAYSSFLVLPLNARGRTLGALSLVSAGSGRRYTADDVPLAEDVARRAAVAIDNARLFTEGEARLHAAETLVEVGRFLNQTLDPEVVGRRLVDSVRALLGSGTAAFYRVDPATLETTVMAAAGEVLPALTPGRSLPMGVATVGLAVRERRPVTTPDVLNDPRIALPEDIRTQIERASYRAVLAVPLLSHERVIGVLALGDRASRRFRAEEILLAQGFAEQATLALENARLYAEAREANRAKDEFLATLSHELRTPLTAMLGWVRMLQSGTLDTATTTRALHVIDRNTKLQAQLIDDLLDVSRIITGKLALDLKPVDVATTVDIAIEALLPAANGKSIALQRRVDAAAAPALADPHRLQQIVWNLLANAIKFTPANGVVTVTVGREDPHAIVRVRDTGQGISGDFLPFIFDRFRQADATTTRAHGGLGLGLAIVHHLVTLHHGTVTAASDGPDRGATFTIRIPLAPVRAAIRAAEDAPVARRARLSGVRVLVVDDEADARDLIAAVLGQSGAEVATAASTAEALDCLGRLRPHVIVSDLAMPGEDGYTLLRRMRALDDASVGGAPAVALTAYARAEDRERALAVGFSSHVPKPVEPTELVEIVARLAAR